MNIFLNLLGRVLVFFSQKKQIYLFNKSKKYIASWGDYSYGYPVVSSFDDRSTLVVGKYVSIASDVSILLGSNHKKGMVTTYPRSRLNKNVSPQETNERGDVVIGNDVWIGYGVTIVGPVVIGDGAIIGASALVVSDVPPYAVVGGVPAKVIRYRFEEDIIAKLRECAWWDLPEKSIKKIENNLYSEDVVACINACDDLRKSA